ncbi:MAG: NADH-quinone oxidoreductase subunit N [Candidatus Omnitrophota bacterium]
MGNVESLAYFIPELILSVAVLLAILADVFGSEREGLDAPGVIALVGTGLAFYFHFGLYNLAPSPLFMGMIAHDMFSAFFRGFFLLSTLVVIVMTIYSHEVLYLKKGEFYAILLSVCIGMCLVAAAQDLVMMYLALELMSIGSYILSGFSSKVGKSDEAAVKFVLYGGVSTGIMLFGLTLLYGLTGSTSFSAIRGILAGAQGVEPAVYTIFVLVMVGAGYKIAAVPFHFWAPDVYEGAPAPVTAYLSVASKGTGFALLIRFFFSTMIAPGDGGASWIELPNLHIDWTFHIALLSAITMTAGNLGAIPQNNLKRLLAFSGIAHAGYLLMGVCVLSAQGMESVVFYLVAYLFTNLAAFSVIVIIVNAQGDERMADVRGLWARAPYTAIAMTIALISLIGLPPTAGFVGKWYLFIAVLNKNLYWLALIAVLNSVVSLYYYARIIRAMFMDSPSIAQPMRVHPVYAGLLAALTIPVVYFGLFWDPLVRYAKMCASLIK